MYKNVLLVAFSEDAHAAARRVAEVAAPSARVEVFRPVYEPLLDGYMGRHDLHAALRQYLVEERLQAAEATARELKQRGLRSFANALWERAYDQAVAREVLAQGIDLVVTEPMRGRAFGLTQQDWRMLSTCPAPVLVVNSDGSAPYRRIVAAVDPMHDHAKPAELDAVVLEHAKALKDLTHAQLRVVHCYTPLAELAMRGVEHVPLEDAERALEGARRTAVNELLTDVKLSAGSAEIIAGKPSTVLKRLVDKGEADLVVMGGLSRGRIKDFIVGSTAERLLEHSVADVLVVKPPGFKVAVAPAA